MAHNASKPSPASLHQLLSAGSGTHLSALIQRAQELHRLDQTVISHLPAPLSLHCRVVTLRGGSLVIDTDSSAWATRLRCHAPELLDRLRGERVLSTLRDIRIKVSIPRSAAELRRRPRPALSDRTAAFLKSVAAATEDTDLRSVLLRLSGRT